jgi:sensor histidine kinase regulating citrate/malate metabolism
MGETKEADSYLTGVEAQLESCEIRKYCGNAVLNALIDSYAAKCAENRIEFGVEIAIPESLAVSSYDMCIVIGNLLENAVDASKKLADGRNIALQTKSTPTQLLIMVKNSFDGAISEKDKSPISGKADGGFGLRSVREVTARHGGNLLTEWDGNTFTAYVAVNTNSR